MKELHHFNIHPIKVTFRLNLDYRLTEDKGPRQSLEKIRGLRKTIHDVIDLCKGENADIKGEFNNVYGAEKEIYNMLL